LKIKCHKKNFYTLKKFVAREGNMQVHPRLFSLLSAFILILTSSVALAQNGPPANGNGNSNGNGGGNKGGGKTVTLSTVKSKDWDEAHVRRVLRAFAYGGFASDGQIGEWAGMKPAQAIAEMLTFEVNNEKLSPSVDANAAHCGSLRELQDFWSSDIDGNLMTEIDRYRYDILNTNQDLTETNLQFAWVKAISTRGCNPFLYKTALYLTNYHGSIHVRNTRAGLIRDYYDDYLEALSAGMDFIQVMTVGAKHAAVSRAYGHQYNRVKDGRVLVNEDFAREYFQLFFSILGTTEDPEIHETITIKNNALLLTGMDLDRLSGAYGADGTTSSDWWTSPIQFSDHTDLDGDVLNASYHYDNSAGASSCLTVLGQQICGATADIKLETLGPIAGAHIESMQNTPVRFITFFADDNLDADKTAQIQGSWAEANLDILAFLQAYAISTAFHDASTFKYFTAFDRNLLVQNANTLTNLENFARRYYRSPYYRMRGQGVEVFEPIRNVFGHQTGVDAANDPYIFKDAYKENVEDPDFLYEYTFGYVLEEGGDIQVWNKDWSSVIPTNTDGDHLVGDIATWLWNHFIGDEGKNFDPIARAQVQSLLAQGRDFGYAMNPADPDPDPPYTSSDLTGGDTDATATDQAHAETVLDLSVNTNKERAGMAINFITMTPYAFAMEGQ
jgi:hypothetical protein